MALGTLSREGSADPGPGGQARSPPGTPKKAGKLVGVRVQMLDDSVTLFQVQVGTNHQLTIVCIATFLLSLVFGNSLTLFEYEDIRHKNLTRRYGFIWTSLQIPSVCSVFTCWPPNIPIAVALCSWWRVSAVCRGPETTVTTPGQGDAGRNKPS